MAGKMSGSSIVAIFACLALLQQLSYAQATVYKVGGNTGWTLPSSSSLYSSWATKETFNVGDTLEFDFTTGQHTVAEVSKSAYDSCNIANPISENKTGPANMIIKTAGTHYYICTVGTHCQAGQKLAVTTAGSASSPTASKSPAGAPSASTTPGGAAADSPTSGGTTPGSAAAGPSASSASSIKNAAAGFVLVSLAALAL